MELHRYVDHQRLHIVGKDRHYIHTCTNTYTVVLLNYKCSCPYIYVFKASL